MCKGPGARCVQGVERIASSPAAWSREEQVTGNEVREVTGVVP